MKIYRLSEEKLKKQTTTQILLGSVTLLLAVISGYSYFVNDIGNVTFTVVLCFISSIFFKAISNLDRFRFELDGTVLTSYLKDSVYYQYDLLNVDVEIVEKNKTSKIIIFENDEAKAIFRASDIGPEAFDELINDTRELLALHNK